MVKIEDITRREEERKLKIKRTKELVNKFFGKVHVIDTSFSISIGENQQSPPFLRINYISDKMFLQIPDSLISKYAEKTIAFAEEYEKQLKVDVTLQTDYSK